MITDPISDMLTRLRNAQRVFKKSADVPYSKFKESILKVLKNEGYIRSYTLTDGTDKKVGGSAKGKSAQRSTGKPTLVVELKYYDNRPVIMEINRKSKPGRRVYSAFDKIPFIANGLGINILSTSRGVIADHEARALNVGGEILCSVM